MNEILNDLRAADKEKFFISHMISKEFREDISNIYYINMLINKIIFSKEDYMVNRIKLQWWHDNILGIYTCDYNMNDITDCIAKTLRKFDIKREISDYLSYSVRFFDNEKIENSKNMEEFAYKINGNLILMGLKILNKGKDISEELLQIVKDYSNATFIVNSLKWESFNLFHNLDRETCLPRDLMDENIRDHDVYGDSYKKLLSEVVMHLIDRSMTYCDITRQKLNNIKLNDNSITMFLPIYNVSKYINKVRKYNGILPVMLNESEKLAVMNKIKMIYAYILQKV